MEFLEDRMKKIALWSAAFLFVSTLSALAQDAPPKPGEEPEDDELTPAQAMEMLKEAHEMMGKAEELLADSSRGKALETEKELLEKLQKEFKDDPALLQKQILEKIGKMVGRAEKRQKDVVDKLAEIIKKAKT